MRHELKVFFVKYNDPIYVKMEKLDIMVRQRCIECMNSARWAYSLVATLLPN